MAARAGKTVPVLSTLSTSGSMAIAQVIVAVGYAIAARAAGPAEFGTAISAVAVGTTLAGLLDFGLAALQTREMASGRSASSDVAARLIDRLIVACLLAALASLLAVLVPSATAFVVAVAVLGVATLATQLAQVVLRASARTNLVALAVVGDKLVFASVVVGLLALHVDGATAVVVGVVSGLLADVACCVLAIGPRRFVRAVSIGLSGGPGRWVLGWRGAGGYGLAAVVTSLQQLDIPIISLTGGAGAAGVYGAVSRWTTPLLLPASAIAQVGVAHAAAAPTTREAFGSLRRVVWIVALAAVASIAVAILAQPLTVLVLGQAYSNSSDALRLLAVATIPTLLAQPLVMIVESRRRERSVAGALLASLLLRLGLAGALAPSMGGVAGAVGVLAQQTLTCVLVARLAFGLLRSEARVVAT